MESSFRLRVGCVLAKSSDITVITPSLPERIIMLTRAVTSVTSQTVQPFEHLISVDHHRHGDGHLARNRLAWAAQTEWLAFLDDDDKWMPKHLEAMLEVSDEADIVCSPIIWEGEGNVAIHSCDFSTMPVSNWFNPSAALVRRAVFLGVGGFPPPKPPMWDDWACWIKLFNAGARYVCTHEPAASAVYHWHGRNISL